MTFVHPPTVVSLTLGAGLTLFDLSLRLRQKMREGLEDLAMCRVGRRKVIDLLEKAGLVTVSRDPFGDILDLTWRADASTVMMNAAQLILKELPVRRAEPLPNMRLKLPGLSLLKESECLRPGGRRLSSIYLAPANLPPAA